MLRDDHNGLQESWRELATERMAPRTLERLAETAKHLYALAEACDTALTRSFLVLERLGYTPDNLPPDVEDGLCCMLEVQNDPAGSRRRAFCHRKQRLLAGEGQLRFH